MLQRLCRRLWKQQEANCKLVRRMENMFTEEHKSSHSVCTGYLKQQIDGDAGMLLLILEPQRCFWGYQFSNGDAPQIYFMHRDHHDLKRDRAETSQRARRRRSRWRANRKHRTSKIGRLHFLLSMYNDLVGVDTNIIFHRHLWTIFARLWSRCS